MKLRNIIIIFMILSAAGCKTPLGNSPSSEPAVNRTSTGLVTNYVSADPVTGSISPGPVIHITPSLKEASVSSKFLFEIQVDNVSNLSAASFYIMFDTALLKFEEAKEGTFLNQNNMDRTGFLFSSNPGKGRIIVGQSRMGQNIGISGSGLLMTVTFEAIAKGTADINFSNMYIQGSDGSSLGTIPVNFIGTKVFIN